MSLPLHPTPPQLVVGIPLAVVRVDSPCCEIRWHHRVPTPSKLPPAQSLPVFPYEAIFLLVLDFGLIF